MPDKKLTDSEIIKALECCVTYKQLCPIICPMSNDKHCMPKLKEYALDLINRLQAENERLNTYLDVISCSTDKIKAEAYKECIENAKEIVVDSVYLDELDDLLKELVGEENAD